MAERPTSSWSTAWRGHSTDDQTLDAMHRLPAADTGRLRRSLLQLYLAGAQGAIDLDLDGAVAPGPRCRQVRSMRPAPAAGRARRRPHHRGESSSAAGARSAQHRGGLPRPLQSARTDPAMKVWLCGRAAVIGAIWSWSWRGGKVELVGSAAGCSGQLAQPTIETGSTWSSPAASMLDRGRHLRSHPRASSRSAAPRWRVDRSGRWTRRTGRSWRRAVEPGAAVELQPARSGRAWTRRADLARRAHRGGCPGADRWILDGRCDAYAVGHPRRPGHLLDAGADVGRRLSGRGDAGAPAARAPPAVTIHRPIRVRVPDRVRAARRR